MELTNIKNYLLENGATLRDVVYSINSWDCSLEELVAYDNDEEFFNMFYENDPMEAVRSAYYGDYRCMDEYVIINAYGNLVSMNEWQYMEMLKDNIDYILNVLVDNKEYVDIYDSKLEEMLEELGE